MPASVAPGLAKPAPVSPEERRRLLLHRLSVDGRLIAADLARELRISEDTIRRDLRELAAAGLVQRVHGGALPPSPGLKPFGVRARRAGAAKQALAIAAARLLGDRQVVTIDGGSTPLAVAQQLPPDLQATIVTPSPPVAMVLAEHPRVDVLVIGGKLDKTGAAVTGAAALDAIRAVLADVFILGICSLDAVVGITSVSYEDSLLKRAMIENAAEVVAVATADKLSTAAPHVVGPITCLTHLVTERAAPDATLEPFARAGVTIVRA